MANKYLNYDGIAYLWEKIKNALAGKVDKVSGKGLSSNDYTSAEKTKLSGIATGAQVNVLEGVQVNGTSVTPTNKIANIAVPTKTSDISNDSGFITAADIPEGAAASTTTPKMDGTAAVGTELAFARGDHVHPSDTNKVDKVSGKGLSTNDFTTALKNKLDGIAAGAEVNVQSDWNAVMRNKTYDILKAITLVWLPALGTLYAALGLIWHLPYVDEIPKSILAIDTFLGALLGISTHQYNKIADSPEFDDSKGAEE